VTGCVAGLEAIDSLMAGQSVIDVSGLTRDPETLAGELQGGTTSIPSVDRVGAYEQVPQAAFNRLTLLLVSPTIGQWPGFGQEMLRTMALLPAIVSRGRSTSHSGLSGLAFSVKSAGSVGRSDPRAALRIPEPTVVLDASTGTLLEARHFDIPLLQAAASDFVSGSSALALAQGAGYTVSADWIDPVGSTEVIEQNALPSWITAFHLIEAITKPTTTSEETSQLFEPILGNGTSVFSASAPTMDQTTMDINFSGSTADESALVSRLEASGLFESVTIKA
jgi:hypothetical protein